ncbi:MAG: hypothetical protein WCB18_02435 [Thermoplasmata archaeon]
MESLTERALGHLFGLIGGGLIIIGGVVAGVVSLAEMILGHAIAAMGALGEATVLAVVGALVLLFAYLGEHEWKERPVASGVLLVILALIGWAALGLGVNVMALVGGIFALLAGALYLIEPSQRVVSTLASPG